MSTGGFSTYEECVAPKKIKDCSCCGVTFAHLGKLGLFCCRCVAAAYCGEECQRKHWPLHKVPCKAEAKRRFDISLSCAEPPVSSPFAMFQVSNFYSSGFGVKADPAESLRWTRLAAEKGYPDAMYFMSTSLSSQGGKENLEEAKRWMTRAAEAGVPRAQLQVANRYKHGAEEENLVKAVFWWRRAAAKGNVDAMRQLARAHLSGFGGVPVDKAEAIRILRVAADDHGSGECAYFVTILSPKSTKAELEDASHYLHRSGNLGWQKAQLQLGHEYSSDKSVLVPMDKAQAMMWYQKAAAGPQTEEKVEAEAHLCRLGFYRQQEEASDKPAPST